MNWQIIVGIVFLIGGIGNITSDFGAFLFGLLVGGALFYWGLKKQKTTTRRKEKYQQRPNISARAINRRPVANKLSIPQQYIIFDIETTGFSRSDDRIIEIAAHKYIKGEKVGEYHTYVNPGRHIPNAITRLTGVRDTDVSEAPTILEVKAELLRFFGSTTLVGHNIKVFDIPFLETQLNHRLTNPRIDTLSLAKDVFPGLPSYKLASLDHILGLGGLEHHRAENDITMNNELFLACSNPMQYRHRISDPDVLNSLVIEDRGFSYKPDIHAFIPSNPAITPDTQLTGKCIVFSGELKILPEEAYQIAVDAGAILKTSVSRKVDYLVQGYVDPQFLDENGWSNKQRTAHKLIQSGEGKVQIITEEEFVYLATHTSTN